MSYQRPAFWRVPRTNEVNSNYTQNPVRKRVHFKDQVN